MNYLNTVIVDSKGTLIAAMIIMWIITAIVTIMWRQDHFDSTGSKHVVKAWLLA